MWSMIGAIALALAVMAGAFGAHALRARLDTYSMGIWEKSVFYHFIHALGLLVVPLFVKAGLLAASPGRIAAILLLVGVVIFSGSLYALALTGVRGLGAVTPIGGLALIAGWLVLAWGFTR